MTNTIALERLMRPASIAVVGASLGPSISSNILRSLQRMGFDGAVHPVHPRHTAVEGVPCYPSIMDLPMVPDVVALCVSGARAEPLIRQAAEKGAGAAVIYDAGFAEQSREGARRQAAIVGMCREAGIALLGPNCMGVLGPAAGSTTWMQELKDPRHLAGSVGIVSQSGAICISLLQDVRRFGYSYMVSSGNEAATTLCDFLEYLIADDGTRIIGLFIEAVREPERFMALLECAHSAGKPVVILKVGRTARTKHAILSHTGGMTGESRVFSEVLRTYRAIEVRDLIEFVETLAAHHTAQPLCGRRIGVVTSSGGLAELILDVADSQGSELPPLAPEGHRAVLERIGSVTGDGNPLDAWGSGDFSNNLDTAFEILEQSPHHDLIALCRDACDNKPFDDPEREREYVGHLIASSKKSAKPHFLLHTRPGLMDSVIVRMCQENGVGILGGLAQGLRAIDSLAGQRLVMAPQRCPAFQGAHSLASLFPGRARSTINEYDAKRLLASHGVPVPGEQVVGDLSAAQAAAQRIGYPIVLKVVADEIAHKSDYGLVAIGLADRTMLAAAWTRMTETLSRNFPDIDTRFIVQRQIPSGIEMFAGAKRDADFGLMFVVGFGGIWIEVNKDFAVRPLPLREGDVEAMLAELRGAAILDGARGRAPADLDALTQALYAIADYAWGDAEALAEIDVNPIIVLEKGEGCFAVDALIVPRQTDTGVLSEITPAPGTAMQSDQRRMGS